MDTILMDMIFNVHGIMRCDVRKGKVSDTPVWATNLNSYTVKVDETSDNILVNPNGKKI